MDRVGDQTDLVLHQISLWVYLLSHSFSLTAVVQVHRGFGEVHGSFGCTITERTLPRKLQFLDHVLTLLWLTMFLDQLIIGSGSSLPGPHFRFWSRVWVRIPIYL